jgi:hypothetical protein
LSKEIWAAEFLEPRGYRTCIVGDLASVVCEVVSDVCIDSALQSALEKLLEHVYSEAQRKLQFESIAPTKMAVPADLDIG